MTLASAGNNFVVQNEADWNAAVTAIDRVFNAAPYTITFAAPSGTIDFGPDALALRLPSFTPVTIVGAGETIDGNGVARGLFFATPSYGNSLTISDLTIANSLASGGAGGPGGGGGAGLGGGLFAGAGGTITLSNVSFVNDQAVGGNGGGGVLGGGGGMGGAGGAGDPQTGTGGGGGGLGTTAYGGNASLPGGTGRLLSSSRWLSTTNYGGGGGGFGGGAPGSPGGNIQFAPGYTYSNYGGGGGGLQPLAALSGAFLGAGFGGGGGSGQASNGGFGGGGGGAFSGAGPGLGGFGGGNGSAGGGGGGLGAGGGLFIAHGAEVTITSGSFTGGAAIGGSGVAGADAGLGRGSAIFLSSLYSKYQLGASDPTTWATQSTLVLNPGSGAEVFIGGAIDDDAGIPLGGGGTLSPGGRVMVEGSGLVILAAAGGYAGGTTISGGRLELAHPAAAGTGAIAFTTIGGTLLVDGAAMPANQITGFQPGDSIDLRGIVAAAPSVKVGGDGVLAIPTAGGTVDLQFDQFTALSGGIFTLAQDGRGGTVITTATPPVAYAVVMADAPGGDFGIGYNSAGPASTGQYLADQLHLRIADQTAVQFVENGGTLPLIAAGQTLILYDTTGYPNQLPDTVPAAVLSRTGGVATVIGGAMDHDTVIAGNGGLDFTAGMGWINVVAGDGSDTINIAPGVTGGVFTLGSGDATINAIGGNNEFFMGEGNHVFTLGIGTNRGIAAGNNTVLGGPGNIDFYNYGTGSDLVLFGPGSNIYTANYFGGSSTVASAGGSDTVIGQNTVYFAGSGTDQFSGTGTVAGGAGSLSMLGESGSLLFAGSGATSYYTNGGASTVVGSAIGTLALTQGGGDVMLFAQGATTVQANPFYGGYQPAGSATVLGISGTIVAAGAQGLFLAAPGGNNHINVAQNSTVFGVAGGDVLSASDLPFVPIGGTATNYLVGGAGSETISGAGSTATNIFFAGTGPEFIQVGDWSTSIVTNTAAATIAGGKGISLTAFINGQHPDVVMQNFNPARDYLTFINFGTGEAAAAIAGAQTVAGSEVLTLSDGTHITFQAVTGVSAANIL